jgi:hypothetical protein
LFEVIKGAATQGRRLLFWSENRLESRFQEALLLKGLQIDFEDHSNAPFGNFDVISLSPMCRVDPV